MRLWICGVALLLWSACSISENTENSSSRPPLPSYQVTATLDGTSWETYSAKAHLTPDSLSLELRGTQQYCRVVVMQYQGSGAYPFANDDQGQGIAYAVARLSPESSTAYSIDGECYLTQVDTSHGHLTATIEARFIEISAQGPQERQLRITASRIPLQNSAMDMNHSSGE